ncbi:putative retrotransposon protein, partial [Tanacetum coccineum]
EVVHTNVVEQAPPKNEENDVVPAVPIIRISSRPSHPPKRDTFMGLKQASRSSNKRFDDKIKEFGFIQNTEEMYVYMRNERKKVVLLIIYVDDILVMENDIPVLEGESLAKEMLCHEGFWRSYLYSRNQDL